MNTPNTFTGTVGANIRAELARRGLSQRTLTGVLNISPTGVSKRLAGKTPLDVDELNKIAEYLGIPITALIDGQDAA